MKKVYSFFNVCAGDVAVLAGQPVSNKFKNKLIMGRFYFSRLALLVFVLMAFCSGIDAQTWYSVTTGGDASNLNNWWSNNNNTGIQPSTFATPGATWVFQSNMTSSAPFTIGGNLYTQPGGTFTPLAGSTTTVGGNWSNFGAFNNNGGTVVFNGSTTGLLLDGSLSGANKFNNLTFNGSGSWSFNGNNVDVAGNFNIASGTVASGISTINVAGNWNNSGAFTSTGGTVNFNGRLVLTAFPA